jgi:hypothetical protein
MDGVASCIRGLLFGPATKGCLDVGLAAEPSVRFTDLDDERVDIVDDAAIRGRFHRQFGPDMDGAARAAVWAGPPANGELSEDKDRENATEERAAEAHAAMLG